MVHKNAIAILFAMVVALLAPVVIVACAMGLTPEEAKTRDDYAKEETACVVLAKTKAEGYDCVCRVRARYGRPCAVPTRDGG